MKGITNITVREDIKEKILTIRGVQVILDYNLAILYKTETRILKQTVKRNIERFPKDFMFMLSEKEIEMLVSQTVIPSKKFLGGGKPYAFTEQGVANLASVLRSKKAIEVNIQIIRAFVQMRKFLQENNEVLNRMVYLERKQTVFEIKTDRKFKKVFDYLQTEKPKQGIFFEGQIFDAYEFVCNLIKNAKKEIILIDNFVDENVLTLFSKRQKNIKVKIYTKNVTRELKLDLQKFNSQYQKVEIEKLDKFHDRFLIIDQMHIYHFGASLKDLGKKCFGFSKFKKEFFNFSMIRNY